MNLGALITSICKRAQSTNKAAKLSGVSQGTLSEWQSGKVSPGLEKYIELCLALGCRPGFELDQYLVLGLPLIEQQRLISLTTAKYAEYLSSKQDNVMIELMDTNN
jgi:transcriptional regulator with XRE-family HTH domain